MKQQILEFDWDALIKREPDIGKACINLTNVILSFCFRLLLDVMIKYGSIQICKFVIRSQ